MLSKNHQRFPYGPQIFCILGKFSVGRAPIFQTFNYRLGDLFSVFQTMVKVSDSQIVSWIYPIIESSDVFLSERFQQLRIYQILHFREASHRSWVGLFSYLYLGMVLSYILLCLCPNEFKVIGPAFINTYKIVYMPNFLQQI